MKKFKKLISLVMAVAMVVGVIQIPMKAEASESVAKFENYEVLQAYAKANSHHSPANGNDGPASYAFDNNANTLWHQRYGGSLTGGKCQQLRMKPVQTTQSGSRPALEKNGW